MRGDILEKKFMKFQKFSAGKLYILYVRQLVLTPNKTKEEKTNENE